MKYPVIHRDKLSDHEFFLLKKESLSNPYTDILVHGFFVREFLSNIYIVANTGYAKKYTKKSVLICDSYAEFMNAYSELKLERML